MDVIVIFTNWDSLEQYLGYKLVWAPNAKQPIETINVSSTSCIIIAFDAMDSTEILEATISATCSRDSGNRVSILHHKSPTIEQVHSLMQVLDQQGIICSHVYSWHGDRTTYGKLKEILNNKNNAEILNTSFNELFANLASNPVLSAKLKLLHSCIIFHQACNATLPPQLQKYEHHLEQFKDGLTTDNHEKRLIFLRDALLPESMF